MRTAPRIALAPEEEAVLARWASDPTGSLRRARRSRIVLDAARGRSNAEIAAELATSPETVARWRSRFAVGGVEGLAREAPRAGDPRRVPPAVVERILEASSDPAGAPPGGWSTRALARTLHVNHMLVHRVWRAHGLSERPEDGRGPAGAPAVHVEVVGALLTRELRALVFLASEPSRAGRTDDVGERSPDVDLEELTANPRRAAEALVHTVRRLERRRGRSTIDPSVVPVFLRTVDRTFPGTDRLDVVVDRRRERIPGRTSRWLQTHPRFRLVTPGPGQAWHTAVERWLSRWGAFPTSPASLRFAPSLEHAFQTDRSLGGRGAAALGSWVARPRPGAGN